MPRELEDKVKKGKVRGTAAPAEGEQEDMLNAAQSTADNLPAGPDKSKLQETIATLRSRRDRELEALEWGELAEKVGRAIARYGAAREGLRSGVDLSKLEMGEPLDWKGRRETTLKRHEQDIEPYLIQERAEAKAKGTKKGGRWYGTGLRLANGDPVLRSPDGELVNSLTRQPLTPADRDKLRGTNIVMKPNRITGMYEGWDSDRGKWQSEYPEFKERLEKGKVSAVINDVEFPVFDAKQVENVTRMSEKFESNNSKTLDQWKAIPTARTIVQNNNPVAAEGVKTVMPRLLGEVGNLAQNEQERFGGSQAIEDKARRLWNKAINGNLTDTDQAYLLDLIDAIENSTARKIQDEAKSVGSRHVPLTRLSREQNTAFVTPGYVHQYFKTRAPAYEKRAKKDWRERAKEIIEERGSRTPEDKVTKAIKAGKQKVKKLVGLDDDEQSAEGMKREKLRTKKRDEEALKWAQDNPDDPRAKKIMERLQKKPGG